MIAGYAAAVTVLMIVERNDRILGYIRVRADHARDIWGSQIVPLHRVIQAIPANGRRLECTFVPRLRVTSSRGDRAKVAGSLLASRPWRGEVETGSAYINTVYCRTG